MSSETQKRKVLTSQRSSHLRSIIAEENEQVSSSKTRSLCGSGLYKEVRRCMKNGRFEAKDINLPQLTCQKYGPDANWHTLTLHDQVDLIREGLRPRACVLDPQSEYIRYWDLIVMCCLLFTAMVTPYEVALLTYDLWGGLYITNRLIDLVFVKDMCLQFFLKVRVYRQGRPVWLRSPRRIAANYLQTWFLFDLIAVLPYDDITNAVQDSADGTSPFAQLKIVRLLRCMRLIKFVRVLKAHRVVRRWENRISLSTSSVYLIKFTFLIVTSSHLMACLWAFIGTFDNDRVFCRDASSALRIPPSDPEYQQLADIPGRQYFFRDVVERDPQSPQDWSGSSWIFAFASGRAAETPTDPCNHFHVYLACLYWAVMTMTSIGYGDILPTTPIEYAIVNICMMVGSILWAYIIGAACTVLSTLNPEQTAFEQRMDAFNLMAEDHHLRPVLRLRGREYIREARRHEHYKRNREVVQGLGRELRGAVMREVAKHYLEPIWIFRSTSLPFREDCAIRMIPHFYERKEIVTLFGNLCVVERGAVGRSGQILVPYGYWGLDMLVRLEVLRSKEYGVTLTFTEIVTLSRSDMNEVALEHPNELDRLRRAAVLLAVRQMAQIRLRQESGLEDEGTGFVSNLFDSLRVANTEIAKAADTTSRVISLTNGETAEQEDGDLQFGLTARSLEDKVDDMLQLIQNPDLGDEELVIDGSTSFELPPELEDRLTRIESRLDSLLSLEEKLDTLKDIKPVDVCPACSADSTSAEVTGPHGGGSMPETQELAAPSEPDGRASRTNCLSLVGCADKKTFPSSPETETAALVTQLKAV